MPGSQQYFIRRMVGSIPILLLISVVLFFLMNLTPGGPLAAYENVKGLRPEDLDRIAHNLGLDQPVHVRYLRWLANVCRGDLGRSYATHRPVLEMIRERLGNTLQLMVTSLIISIFAGFSVGVISAVKQYSLFDYVTTTLSLIGFCVPIFWLGLLLIIAFAVYLKVLPSGGMYSLGVELSLVDTIIDRARHMIMPVFCLALYQAAWQSRYLRSSMLEVLHQDYIRTARAKGLAERVVLLGHALKNAALPVVTAITLQLPWLFSGAILTETIFSWPGMGRLLWESARERDYPVMMGLMIITSVMVFVANMLADFIYVWADPRIRYD